VGRAFGRRADAIAVAFLVVALLPVAWAATETVRRGPHVPPSIQRRLPTDISLGNLCPGAETPPDVERDVRRRADEQRDITIRELAQTQLEDMESSGSRCDPELERRLRAAM
jgi:hypothetical protein